MSDGQNSQKQRRKRGRNQRHYPQRPNVTIGERVYSDVVEDCHENAGNNETVPDDAEHGQDQHALLVAVHVDRIDETANLYLHAVGGMLLGCLWLLGLVGLLGMVEVEASCGL